MVGVDVGIWSTKVVELQRRGGTYELKKVYMFPTDRSIFAEKGREIQKEMFVHFLKYTVRRCKLRFKKITISLNNENCIVKYTRIPQTPEDQMENLCWRAIEGNVPFNKQETNIDCKITDINEETKDMGVVVVAAKKDLIENLMDVFKKAGVKLAIIDADDLALYNIWEANYALESEKNVLIVDIGAKLTKMSIIIDAKPCFGKMFYIGGCDVTDAIQKGMGVEEAEAERMKIKLAEDLPVERKEEISNISREKMDSLFKEIKSSADLFYRKEGEEFPPIEKVFLCGGSSELPFLKDVAKQYFNVSSVEKFNPFDVFVVKKGSLEYIEKKAASFAIAAGLALRQ